ncbi:MAG: thiamine ABC transporter substrate binding subunit [Acidimicrobiia bacterium]
MTRPAPARLAALALAGGLLAAAAAGCGDDGGGGEAAPTTVRLLTHDSFTVSDEVLEAFTEETGLELEVIQGGDAGTVVNQALLSKGNPQADVLFGIDSTFLSRALDEGLFTAHEAEGIDGIDEAFVLDPEHRVTPVDYGDVCLNFDVEWFAENRLPVPETFEDLVDPRYRDLLVVENPATSSPGLAFLLATIEATGEDGWEDWWTALRANGVEVVAGWEEAYNGAFSGGSGQGTRPLVVSYASSPPAEVAFADPPVEEAPTGVIEATCYRQVELAGVLAGTDRPEAAGRLVDFMLSRTFQEDLPMSMFVFPVDPDAALPEVFVEHAARPAQVLEMEPERIAAGREGWIDRWTDLVVR